MAPRSLNCAHFRKWVLLVDGLLIVFHYAFGKFQKERERGERAVEKQGCRGKRGNVALVGTTPCQPVKKTLVKMRPIQFWPFHFHFIPVCLCVCVLCYFAGAVVCYFAGAVVCAVLLELSCVLLCCCCRVCCCAVAVVCDVLLLLSCVLFCSCCRVCCFAGAVVCAVVCCCVLLWVVATLHQTILCWLDGPKFRSFVSLWVSSR